MTTSGATTKATASPRAPWLAHPEVKGMVTAIDRLQAAWELVGPVTDPLEAPAQIQSAVAGLFRARDDAVPPGVGR